MHGSYEDITDVMGEPRWWDENGCPRYCGFGTQRLANIYAVESCLVLIECQSCGREFKTAFSRSRYDVALHGSLADLIRHRTLHYGDPPNTSCCPTGPTMNSIPIRVLEYWSGRDADGRLTDPVRVHELELPIVPDWAGGAEERLETRIFQLERFRAMLGSAGDDTPAEWARKTPWPWARALSLSDAREMCDELETFVALAAAEQDIDGLEGCLAGWRSTAGVYESREELEALLGSGADG